MEVKDRDDNAADFNTRYNSNTGWFDANLWSTMIVHDENLCRSVFVRYQTRMGDFPLPYNSHSLYSTKFYDKSYKCTAAKKRMKMYDIGPYA